MATNGAERGVEKPRRADSIMGEQSQLLEEEHNVAVISYVYPEPKVDDPFEY
jgi:hypothetical protein